MTVKEELINIIDNMQEENLTKIIDMIKEQQYLDEAINMEANGKVIVKTLEELEEFEQEEQEEDNYEEEEDYSEYDDDNYYDQDK